MRDIFALASLSNIHNPLACMQQERAARLDDAGVVAGDGGSLGHIGVEERKQLLELHKRHRVG